MADIATLIIILIFAGAGFFLGGVNILVELLQFGITLLFAVSLKPYFIKLFSSFMQSPLFTEISAMLILFAIVYLLLSIAVTFIYKFFEPFKGLLLNKIAGLICGTIIGIVFLYTIINMLSTRHYFKNILQDSYFYKIVERKQ
ncbi:MAG: CvpA family protein [Planctomycetota bacterium]